MKSSHLRYIRSPVGWMYGLVGCGGGAVPGGWGVPQPAMMRPLASRKFESVGVIRVAVDAEFAFVVAVMVVIA